MDKPNIEEYKERFLAAWNNLLRKSNEEEMAEMGRERIVVFVVALILALCLWLMVNLSLVYNLNVELPISLGSVPQDQALAEDYPDHATVSLSGEGWKLINLYNNPPGVTINVSDSEVNMFDQVQQQMNAHPAISVQKVQPLILTLELEERITKKVPVRSAVDVSFREQYDFLDSVSIEPDSVTISGARSLVRNITEWRTDSVSIDGVASDLSRTVSLQDPGKLINLSREQVNYSARVAQFTEGEVKVAIDTRDAPSGRSISYSPSTITVKYDVPIDEYADVQDTTPFNVFVSYSQIEKDASGFVTPQIEKANGDHHIKLRSFQPRRVAYFMVLDQ